MTDEPFSLLIKRQICVREAEYAHTASLHLLTLQRSSADPIVLTQDYQVMFSSVCDPFDIFNLLCPLFTVHIAARV